MILALIDLYVLGGLREMTDPAVFRVSPFREMGEAYSVVSAATRSGFELR